MIKEINGWFYIVNLGAFHGFPFPTRAVDALQEIELRNNRRLSYPVDIIIHGQQLTGAELRRLVEAEANQKEPHKCV